MVAAIVVLFHPNLRTLERLMSSLINQVDCVIAVDNTPGQNLQTLQELRGLGIKISFIALGENKGIAAAQNVGIAKCKENGFTHVLLLDQDSSIFPGMVQKMLEAEQKLLEQGISVGAICPRVDDCRSGLRPAAVHYRWFSVRQNWSIPQGAEVVATDNLIASGSLIRIETINSVGKMREDLFIEYVDTEWAFRAGSLGYRHYCVSDAYISHSLGDQAKCILGKSFFIYKPIRYQYKLRNAVFLLRLKSMGWHWRLYTALRTPYHLLLYSLLSENPCRTFVSLLQAIGDGMRGRLGPIALSPKGKEREDS